MYWQRTHLKHQNQDPFLRCCCLWLTQSHGIQYSKYCDNDSSSNIAHRHLSDSHFISLLAILSCSTPAKTSYDWSKKKKSMLLQLSSSLTITNILVQRQAADMWSRTVLRLTPSQHFTAKYSGRHTRASSSCEMVEVVKKRGESRST